MATRLLRQRFPFRAPDASVDHLVVGAGVVGLAVAERLVKAFPDRSTFVVERNSAPPGQETSSRNSEVIHSGIYYPVDSLKTRLCIRGRELIYQRQSVRSKKTGKLILATSKGQQEYLSNLADKCAKLPKSVGKVPLRMLTGDEARQLEPDVGPSVTAALFSTETGIVDSHGLIEDLEQAIIDSEAGDLVYGTRVVRIDKAESWHGGKRGDGSQDGWVVQTASSGGDRGEDEVSAVLAKTVINCAGLNAHHILNHIMPEDAKPAVQHFAKGSYWGYRGPGVSNIKRLLYPCPDPNALAGLGTHLTLNMDNEIRFGPDVEWLELPRDDQGLEEPDSWKEHLAPSEAHLEAAIESVRAWLPGISPDGFSADYSGIRPKLSAKGQPALDFSIKQVAPGFVSLNGIESPGLTSALAIGEMVEGIVKNEILGMNSRGKGRHISNVGHLDAWA